MPKEVHPADSCSRNVPGKTTKPKPFRDCEQKSASKDSGDLPHEEQQVIQTALQNQVCDLADMSTASEYIWGHPKLENDHLQASHMNAPVPGVPAHAR